MKSFSLALDRAKRSGKDGGEIVHHQVIILIARILIRDGKRLLHLAVNQKARHEVVHPHVAASLENPVSIWLVVRHAM